MAFMEFERKRRGRIRGTFWKTVANLLAGRTIGIKLDNFVIDRVIVILCPPQGSISLPLLLFLYYVTCLVTAPVQITKMPRMLFYWFWGNPLPGV